MTSAKDVARFVVRALDFAQWPPELWMQGDRMSVWNVVHEAERMRGTSFSFAIDFHSEREERRERTSNWGETGQSYEKLMHNSLTLQHALNVAATSHDWTQVLRVQNMIATAENRYDFTNPVLNGMVDFTPVGFFVWLREAWRGQ